MLNTKPNSQLITGLKNKDIQDNYTGYEWWTGCSIEVTKGEDGQKKS